MKRINLQGKWRAEIEEKKLNFNFPVPGDLASALLAEKHIPHPYVGVNERDIQWIGKINWRCWTVFSLTADEVQPSWLEIEILDTVAEVYLNDRLVGSSRNMFAPLSLKVDEELKEGENRLEIRFTSPEKAAQQEADALPYPVPCTPYANWAPSHRNLLRKVQCHSGWDWGPVIMTSGIYGAIFLHLGRDRIEYLNCSQSKGNDEVWQLAVTVDYLAESAGSISLDYRLSDPAFSGEGSSDISATQQFEVRPGRNKLEYVMSISDPRLWWPVGYGSAELYELEVCGLHEQRRKRIGFRTIEVICDDDAAGRSMYFRINGRDLYAKGANWIPPDALPAAQSDDRYVQLLTDAATANMNMIRLWGGGQYEKDIFYDLCDELGLLIWHDMMFACALYPATSNFLSEVEAEITHQIKRLKDHPSIALWCGNNEDIGALTWYEEAKMNRDRYLVDYDRLNEGVIGRLVRSLDPARTWWPSSPSAGEGDYSDCWHDDSKGDMHYWSVWHEGLPFESYYDVIPRFCSEFGFQSFPSLPTVQSFAHESEWNISAPVMLHHQRNDRGNSIILSTIVNYFRMPKNFEETLYVSQIQQAFAMQTAVEYWRSKRPLSMGALYWQLNDNWPVASWSSLEYGGRWKLLHYVASRFFATLWLALYEEDGRLQVHGLNDKEKPVGGNLQVRIIDFKGEVIRRFTGEGATVAGDSAAELWSLPLSDLEAEQTNDSPVAENAFLHAIWETDEGSVNNSFFLAKPQSCALEPATINIVRGGGVNSFLLSTDRPVFYLFPECDIPGHFSDGGFTLLPGEPKEIRFIPQDATGIVDDIRVKHLRNSY